MRTITFVLLFQFFMLLLDMIQNSTQPFILNNLSLIQLT
ncbi:hypothetical protein ACINIS123_D0001 [Acinetobacter baumannii IS-123]|nr:hypothetical protein ACINIS123_D0001 [Acinetobacter baumannii IS-123]